MFEYCSYPNILVDIPFSSHMIKCSDNVYIHAWLLHQQRQPKSVYVSVPTIIFFHGNAGNIGLRLPNAVQMYHTLGCNILMVEYRGYGDSDDVKPTEKGLKLDAEAAYNFLLSNTSSNTNNITNNMNIDPEQIFVFGRSLGGAVAFHLAKYAEQTLHKPLKGIIVENTFTSISKMVDALMPAIAPFKFLVLTIDWNSEKIAPTIHTPILYLAGDKDELVPHSQMKTLYNKSKMNGASVYASMHIIKNGTHNDSWVQGGRTYYNAIQSFMSHVTLHGNSLSLLLEQRQKEQRKQQLQSVSVSGRSSSSLDDSLDVTGTTCSTSASLSTEVTMGGETGVTAGAIPIMPKSIVGIAKEKATKMFASDSNINTKKEI